MRQCGCGAQHRLTHGQLTEAAIIIVISTPDMNNIYLSIKKEWGRVGEGRHEPEKAIWKDAHLS